MDFFGLFIYKCLSTAVNDKGSTVQFTFFLVTGLNIIFTTCCALFTGMSYQFP